MSFEIPFSDASNQLTPADCQAVLHLWSELQQLATFEVERELERIGTSLRALCAADDMFLMLTWRDATLGDDDPLSGWRPLRVDNPCSEPMRKAVVATWMENLDHVIHDPANQLMTRQAGRARGYMLDDVFAAHGDERAPTWRLIEALGLADRLVCACPVTRDVEIFLGLDRHLGSGRFTSRDRDVSVVALNGLLPLWTGFARSLGAIEASALLTRRERDVLCRLLDGYALNEIAEQCQVSASTIRQHTRNLYHKFNVSGRAELAALWMRGSSR